MTTTTRRLLLEGVVFGLIAGVIFMVAAIVAAVVLGYPASMPLRMSASVLAREDALASASVGILLLGVVVHLVSSALYGLGYAALVEGYARFSVANRAIEAAFGFFYGLAVWLVNFQILARFAHPWLTEAPQVVVAALYAFFFGVPLGVLFAVRERKLYRGYDEPGRTYYRSMTPEVG